MTRAIRQHELTPEARIDAAKRKLVEAIDELVEARLAKGATASEWVDQYDSPLGKRRHLELVRAGTLRGVIDRHRRLVRRADIDRYLEEHPTQPRQSTEEDLDGMVARITGVGR